MIRGADGNVRAIVEERDATPQAARDRRDQHRLHGGADRVAEALARAPDADNAQGEYYLTDIVAMAVARRRAGRRARRAATKLDVLGVNDRAQLAALERIVQRRRATTLMLAGTSIVDPARIDIRGELACGRDVTIDVGCVFEGTCRLGDGVASARTACCATSRVGAGHADRAVLAFRVGNRSARNCRIGPYARLRPGTDLAEDVHVGNFVEVKASTLGAARKANHLAYVGDATVGSRRQLRRRHDHCNYDGANKHQHVIEDDVLIGSNCVLVAPVDGRRGRDDRRRQHDHPGRAGRPADGRAGEAGHDRGLAAAAQEERPSRAGSEIMCGIVGADRTRTSFRS